MSNENRIKCRQFGIVQNHEITLYELNNGTVKVELTNYGCTIVSIYTPDKWGNHKNIVAGFNNLTGYLLDHPYMGCIVGRYANRIANGEFCIDGRTYHLPLNDGVNHLHGGVQGFNRKIWKVEKEIEEKDKIGIVFSYLSTNNEEGYPGNLDVTVTYLLDSSNNLSIQYQATSDQSTILSLTNHSYFNLTGFEEKTIYNHYLKINADSYTEKNESNTPSGVIRSISQTPLDFSRQKEIGRHIHELKIDKGYDHNFVLKNDHLNVNPAAFLYEPNSGRTLTVYTNQPGIQVYTANWWDGKLTGAQNKPYCKHGAVALETQAFPDSPNHPDFPSVILRPDEKYEKETIFHFNLCE